MAWASLSFAVGSVDFDVVSATLAPGGDRIDLQFDRPLDPGHPLVFDNNYVGISRFLAYHQIKAALGNWIAIDSVSYSGGNGLSIGITPGTVSPGEFVTVTLAQDAVRDGAGNAYRGHTVIVHNQLEPDTVYAELLAPGVPAGELVLHQDDLGAAQATGDLQVSVSRGGVPVANAPVSVFRVTNNTSWAQVGATVTTGADGIAPVPALTVDGSFYVLRVANAYDRLMTVVPSGQKLVRTTVNGSYSRTVRTAILDSGARSAISNANTLELHGFDHHLHHYRVPAAATALELLVEDETIPMGTRSILHRQTLAAGALLPPYAVDVVSRSGYTRTWKPREPGDSNLRDVFELTLFDADNPANRQTFAVRGPWERDIEFWLSEGIAHPSSRLAFTGSLSGVGESYAVYVHMVPLPLLQGSFNALAYPGSAALTLMYAVDAYNGGFGTLANDLPELRIADAGSGAVLGDVRVTLRPFHTSASSRRDALYRLAAPGDGTAAHIGNATYVVGQSGLWYYFTRDRSLDGPLPLRVQLGSALGVQVEQTMLGRGDTQAFHVVDADGFVLSRLINSSLVDQPVTVAIAHGGSNVGTTTNGQWQVPADASFGTYQTELVDVQGFPLDAATRFASFEVATMIVAGTCGSANGTLLATAPDGGGLCATGTADGLLGGSTGPWLWTCRGANGGTDALCSASPDSLPEVIDSPYLPPGDQWPALVDDDGDGVPDYIESLAPRPDTAAMGDGNGDGTADLQQGHVASIPTAAGGGFASIESAGGHQLEAVAALPAPASLPPGVDMPWGMFGFRLTGLAAGATEELVVLVPYDTRINAYLKQNRVTGQWENIAQAVTRTGNKTRLVIRLTDGDAFDQDSAINGVIDDPGGPAFVPGTPTPVPTLGQGALAALALLVAAAATASGRATARRR